MGRLYKEGFIEGFVAWVKWELFLRGYLGFEVSEPQIQQALE